MSLKEGDILLEISNNYNHSDSEYIYRINIWEMPKNNDGHGYHYTIQEEKTIFAWTDIYSSIKINMSEMPKDFQYSFKHGMSDIKSKIKTGTAKDIIENSNWKEKEIKKEEVEKYYLISSLELNNKEDIKNNIKLLTSKYIPLNIKTKVLNIFGIKASIPQNGEIGIAGMNDNLKYSKVLYELKKEIAEK